MARTRDAGAMARTQDAGAMDAGAMARAEQESDMDMLSRYSQWEKIGEGTYGKVYKAECIRTRKHVAIKKIRILHDEEGVPSTALREITLLKDVEGHPNVVALHDVFSNRSALFLVFECLDMDLRAYLRNFEKLQDGLLRSCSLQLVNALEFCHSKRILHRDVKPQNVLVELSTMRMVLADFGLARPYSVPLRAFTHEVVTLWYRDPSILLGQERYGPGIDIWSLGCIIPEMATGQAIFPGDSEIDTIFRIFRVLGTPTEDAWPGVQTLKDWKRSFPQWPDSGFSEVRRLACPSFGDVGVDLLGKCLKYNSVDRWSARRLQAHAFFEGVDRAYHNV